MSLLFGIFNILLFANDMSLYFVWRMGDHVFFALLLLIFVKNFIDILKQTLLHKLRGQTLYFMNYKPTQPLAKNRFVTHNNASCLKLFAVLVSTKNTYNNISLKTAPKLVDFWNSLQNVHNMHQNLQM